MTDLRTAAQQAIALICSARLCEVNSMSSRQEMLRLLIEATDLLRAVLAEPDIDPVDEYRKGFIAGQIDMRDRPAEPVQEPDYWQEEARRYAGNADYWRKRYEVLAEPVQEPVALKWLPAPRKTEWGFGMVSADVEIDRDHTLTMYCEDDQTAKVDAMFRRVLCRGESMTTITLPRAVIEQALDALEGFAYHGKAEGWPEAITALRAALAQHSPAALIDPRGSLGEPIV